MDPRLRSSLGIKGTVTFESPTNLRITDDATSEPMQHMSLGKDGTGEEVSTSAPAPRPPATLKPRRRASRKGNRADQLCIYRTSDGYI